ncbi:MAG TPA: DNA polymerase III subunit delta' [Dissulfurispiraceae bacterium]|nr:DNA polymerase III subunit delta' [Dissulfurispiraceae bacterium]
MAFADIIGQEGAVRILLGTVRKDRIPTAFLLSGDSGIGKRLAALNYAKAVNCVQSVQGDCCDRCQSCRKIDAGIHPDVTVIAPENNEIKIEAVRSVIDVLSLKAFEGKRKVVVIEDADAMNPNAANAFLKTLEEPPPGSLILLTSSRPDMLPATIGSRCVQVRFRPLSREECKEILRSTFGEAGGDDVLGLVMGRPGLAASGDVAKKRVWFMRLLDQMLRSESREGWADRTEMRSWLDMCTILLRDLAVYTITQRGADLLLGRAFKSADLATVLETYRQVERVKGLVDVNLNKLITWNYLAASMRRCIRQ